jgi:hypothetical protein
MVGRDNSVCLLTSSPHPALPSVTLSLAETTTPTPTLLAKTIAKILKFLADAAAKKADVLVLPEAVVTGYDVEARFSVLNKPCTRGCYWDARLCSE